MIMVIILLIPNFAADNFLIGRGAQSKIVFAVDYGLSKLYMDPKSNRHISYKEGKNLIGTVRYASLYTHMGIGKQF